MAVLEARRNERGVTLVETLVALLILSFVAVSTLAMFSQGMRLNAAGSDYMAITNVAKDKCEELLSLAYTSADLNPNQTYTEDLSSPDVLVVWEVAEHAIVQGNADPQAIFAGDPMLSTAAGSGNIKVLEVTVSSQGVFGLGKRTVTVQGIKDVSSGG